MPIQRPGPFSTLRRLAYEEGMPLFGPTIDPTGWHASSQIRIQGKVFNDRSIDMGCTVRHISKLFSRLLHELTYLESYFLLNLWALPLWNLYSLELIWFSQLCYTKGSVIPLILLLESQDLEALDLLSSPRSIVVRLQRLIKYHSGQSPTSESSPWTNPNFTFKPPKLTDPKFASEPSTLTYSKLENLAWRNAVEYSPLARWWPSADISADFRSKRYLNGELHLGSDVKPTSAMVHFRMEVFLHPFCLWKFHVEPFW